MIILVRMHSGLIDSYNYVELRVLHFSAFIITVLVGTVELMIRYTPMGDAP